MATTSCKLTRRSVLLTTGLTPRAQRPRQKSGCSRFGAGSVVYRQFERREERLQAAKTSYRQCAITSTKTSHSLDGHCNSRARLSGNRNSHWDVVSPPAIYGVTSSQALCIPIHEAMDSRDQSIELGFSTQVHEPRLASQVYEPRRALLEGQLPLAEGFIPIA